MPDDRFEKYNTRRAEISRRYRAKKWTQVLLILGGAVLLIVIINLLSAWLNIAVRLVSSVLLGLFSIIFARIRTVTLEHAKQQKLEFLEEHEPAFHANFK